MSHGVLDPRQMLDSFSHAVFFIQVRISYLAISPLPSTEFDLSSAWDWTHRIPNRALFVEGDIQLFQTVSPSTIPRLPQRFYLFPESDLMHDS